MGKVKQVKIDYQNEAQCFCEMNEAFQDNADLVTIQTKHRSYNVEFSPFGFDDDKSDIDNKLKISYTNTAGESCKEFVDDPWRVGMSINYLEIETMKGNV